MRMQIMFTKRRNKECLSNIKQVFLLYKLGNLVRLQLISLIPWRVPQKVPPSCEAPREPTIYAGIKFLSAQQGLGIFFTDAFGCQFKLIQQAWSSSKLAAKMLNLMKDFFLGVLFMFQFLLLPYMIIFADIFKTEDYLPYLNKQRFYSTCY